MNFQFYGYTVRQTTVKDLELSVEWCKSLPLQETNRDLGSALTSWTKQANFWIKQGGGCESFLVSEAGQARCKCGHRNTPDHYLTSQDEEGELWCLECSCREYWNGYENLPLGFFQIQHIGKGDQVRLAFQASPVARPKKILRAITKLVPLIERALCLRGVRAIFLTSHSLTMVAFMENLGYSLQPNIDGGADGVVMAKQIGKPAEGS